MQHIVLLQPFVSQCWPFVSHKPKCSKLRRRLTFAATILRVLLRSVLQPWHQRIETPVSALCPARHLPHHLQRPQNERHKFTHQLLVQQIALWLESVKIEGHDENLLFTEAWHVGEHLTSFSPTFADKAGVEVPIELPTEAERADEVEAMRGNSAAYGEESDQGVDVEDEDPSQQEKRPTYAIRHVNGNASNPLSIASRSNSSQLAAISDRAPPCASNNTKLLRSANGDRADDSTVHIHHYMPSPVPDLLDQLVEMAFHTTDAILPNLLPHLARQRRAQPRPRLRVRPLPRPELRENRTRARCSSDSVSARGLPLFIPSIRCTIRAYSGALPDATAFSC
ncbi:hypothetical protein B0J12DRAFT_726707 [Macrophomina phaseolina]|uniref:Uncharacterized protein n=1 Tax=Macrophomina phaseolina TaxID=35725 RepID=A0ABQ8GH06_9PEZI|nr:hypothetical protein B0J12DRAFT_726707 [Macrophomina phaseolina]